jgi:hypothetical protein
MFCSKRDGIRFSVSTDSAPINSGARFNEQHYQVEIFHCLPHREILRILPKDLDTDERPPSCCEFYESEVVKERV